MLNLLTCLLIRRNVCASIRNLIDIKQVHQAVNDTENAEETELSSAYFCFVKLAVDFVAMVTIGIFHHSNIFPQMYLRYHYSHSKEFGPFKRKCVCSLFHCAVLSI